MNSARRRFLEHSALWAGIWASRGALASGESQKVQAAVWRLYASLSSEQLKVLVLPYADERRLRPDANFDVTRPRIGGAFYSESQRDSIRLVLEALLSPEGYARIVKQMKADAGGLSGYHMAFFELPGASAGKERRQVEWLLTGRHITLRANTVTGARIAGPRVYGHGEWRPERSLYFRQFQLANSLYSSLDKDQRGGALLEDAPYEEEVGVSASGLKGLGLHRLSPASRKILRNLAGSLTELFEPQFSRLVSERLLAPESLKRSRIAFYREDDLREDGKWDLWRVQGPGYTWHFRGAPHVHAYLNLG